MRSVDEAQNEVSPHFLLISNRYRRMSLGIRPSFISRTSTRPRPVLMKLNIHGEITCFIEHIAVDHFVLQYPGDKNSSPGLTVL